MEYKASTVGVELREAKSDLPVKSNSFATFFEAVIVIGLDFGDDPASFACRIRG